METIDDIVREMRDKHPMGEHTFDSHSMPNFGWHELANRIEAVVKRDLTTATDINVGSNAAKMREALEHIREYATVALSHTTDSHVIDAVHNMDALAKSALAEPLRNCDVGTAEEQGARFRGFCDKHNCERCPVGGDEYLTNCFSRWSQMPYEEGGEK